MDSQSFHSEDQRSWQGDFDPFDDPEERRVLFAAFDSFRQYRRTAHQNTTHRRRQAFYSLPSEHWQMLSEPPFSILDNLNEVDDAIDTNAELADKILDGGLESFGLAATPDKEDPTQNWHGTATASDVNKAHSTIRQFYRDWSAEGRVEREVCYDPVLQDLRTEFQARRDASEEIKVLIPGAGLGRLVFDVCLAGFSAEGNEISYHQLLASSWVLNHTEGPQSHTLHPFALHFSNLKTRAQQLRSVQIPDVHPGTAIGEAMQANRSVGSMSMSTGDFVVVYNEPSNRQTFDAVATVFFIDTAPNLIRYIEAIHHCLKEDGLWINVGPLLWHFEDSHPRRDAEGDTTGIGEPGNVELTEEEVLTLVERMGFRIEARPDDRRPCGYIQDGDSMLQNIYQPSHWVARKTRVAGA
ncbi:hypothetical protein N7448_007419 [Penicillium atrosanguineum]|uniref:uncharacterized protein n=1 Tax=Penicillium atrosanguineum TaxID=1132637 RepID=UPI002382C2A0|nr:uncharacterized protein N7443_001554 [Penicillium atrosanguineum]KAJ5126640.1 hypothetical protein N7448_007419 [Penicillium atrosanguineum]KAJ5314670.1 hypothetical protein N7443_001554 [Penicillium atrosanguineum]